MAHTATTLSLVALTLLCGCGGAGEGPAPGGASAREATSGSEKTESEPTRPGAGAQVLLGAWTQKLDPVDARTIELMAMALEHPSWKTRDVRRLRLPPDESANLEAFLGLLRFDPEARARFEQTVKRPGMRARFTEDTIILGREDTEDVEVPFRVAGVDGAVIRIVLGGAAGGEATAIELIDDDTFRAPWGSGQEYLTFVRKGD